MKHHLSLLCFALTSFLYVNETVANLLLKQNPTPLEPASYASSGESYQLAKVTWLPDYLGHNKSYGVNRVNDGGGSGSDRGCSTYGLLSSCPPHSIGKGTKHPVAGLACYEECVCDESYYKYSSSNCASPKILGGETCSDLSSKASEQTPSTEYYSECRCPSEYNLSTCPTNANCESCGNKYKLVNCKDGYIKQNNSCVWDCSSYPLTSCPTNATCDQCDNKYKQTGCMVGYSNQNGTCVKVEDCSAYPLTTCPTGGTCSNCPDNSAKKKLDSCDTAQGWKLSGNTCVAIACPSGYSAGITICSDKSYTYYSNGKSGGEVCGRCVKSEDCNAYPLTVCPIGCNCSTCPDNSSRYKIDSAKTSEGWEVSGNTCRATPCLSSYSRGVTGCSDIENYHYFSKGKSGGEVCGKCSKYIKLGINASGDNSNLIFSLKGNDYTIDWGDGTEDSNSTHTYATAGEYIVIISDGIMRLIAGNSSAKITKLYKLDLDTIIEARFSANCEQLTGEIPNLPPNLGTGDYMFQGCSGLTGHIPALPTAITNGNSMFRGCTGLTGSIPNLPPNLKTGDGMFQDCIGLTGNIPMLPTTMIIGNHMFNGCSGLTGHIPALPTTITNGNAMFKNCTGLTGIAPTKPESLEQCTSIFYGTNITTTTGWQSCQ